MGRGETAAKATDPKLAPPEGILQVALAAPRMIGCGGPSWPKYCFLDAGVGGAHIDPQVLALTEKDLNEWNLSFEIPVGPGWRNLSLDLLVERVDYDVESRRGLVLLRGGPHTTRYTAVVSRARVPLLDALVIGDVDDDDDEEVNKAKMRRRGTRLEGTVVFDETVPLLDWEMPAIGVAGAGPRSVVRGTVHVRMRLREPR